MLGCLLFKIFKKFNESYSINLDTKLTVKNKISLSCSKKEKVL